jgi:pimeloyl-ACP methyl ester carboxylesterase
MSPAAATSRSPAQSSVEVDGVRVAYRAYGEHHEGVPLVLLHRFRATMDDWDPALSRLSQPTGVYSPSTARRRRERRRTPATLEEAQTSRRSRSARSASAKADFLGWSMGA